MDALSLQQVTLDAEAESMTVDPDLQVTGWTDLRMAILALEEAVAAPSQGQNWIASVGAALQRLAHDIAAHVAAEDGPGGLYRLILADAPRLAGEVRRLRTELDEIAGLVAWLLAVVAAGPMTQGVDWRRDVREDVNVLIFRLIRHRQSDHDLIYEAYTVDVGDAD
jgi:hypothetical protein